MAWSKMVVDWEDAGGDEGGSRTDGGCRDRRYGITRGKRHVCVCVCGRTKRTWIPKIDGYDNQSSTSTAIRHYQGLLDLAYAQSLAIELATGSHLSLEATTRASTYEPTRSYERQISDPCIEGDGTRSLCGNYQNLRGRCRDVLDITITWISTIAGDSTG